MMRMMMMMCSISSGSTPTEGERDVNITIFTNPDAMSSSMAVQMHDIFRLFNGMLGDWRSAFGEDSLDHFGSVMDITPETVPREGSIRDHYLKPGYRAPNREIKQDTDLDGKVSTDEIASLLKRKDSSDVDPRLQPPQPPGALHSGPIVQTIITKTITKPDGTMETRRIVKDNLGNVEETLTTTEASPSSLQSHNDSIIKMFDSFWKMF